MPPSRAPADPTLLSWLDRESPADAPGRPLLVLLHGAEDEPVDVLAWAGVLDPSDRCRAVAVSAPFGSAPEGRVWFRSSPRGPNPDDVRQAVTRLDATIGHLRNRSGRQDCEVVVVGHSQGGAMALMLAADPTGRSIRGVVSVCGWLPDVDGWPIGSTEQVRSAPRVLVLNTRGDDVVPVDFGEAAALALEAVGHPVERIVTEGGHHPADETLRLVRDWLADPGAEGTRPGDPR